MVSEVATLSGSFGVGTLVGLAKIFLENRAQANQVQAELEFKKELATRDALESYQRTINEVQGEADLTRNTKWKLSLFGKEISYEANQRKETLIRSLASWSHSTALLLFVLALSWICIIWADTPDRVVWTFNPQEQPTTFKLWLLEWSFHRTKISEVTTGGLSFILAHGILGIIGFILTGTKTRK